MKLENKNILITGATSGIGLNLVETLYQHNNIFIIARNKQKINELKNRFPKIVPYQVDLIFSTSIFQLYFPYDMQNYIL